MKRFKLHAYFMDGNIKDYYTDDIKEVEMEPDDLLDGYDTGTWYIWNEEYQEYVMY